MQRKIAGILTALAYFCSAALFAKTDPTPGAATTAIKVEVIKTNTGYQLLRGGKPYFVKGAGGRDYLDRVAAYGGNSIRTWSTDHAQQILDSAHKYGLTVLLGLPVAAERHGFNYSDAAAVKKQFEKVKQEVLKYKDHPALLGWGIGNELNLFYTNNKVWDAANDIAQMIATVDPNHLATLVLAGIHKRQIDEIKKSASAIKLLSVNTYGGLATLPSEIKAAGWDGPYMVTEWGPTGHWEGLETAWKAPIEETSSEKAAVYKSRYGFSVEKDIERCLGSFVFLWGQKQERTPTWYGMFTANGEESEVVDVVHYLWKGTYPANMAPHLYSFRLNEQKPSQNIYLKAGERYTAVVLASDPDGDTLKYTWEMLPEATNVGEGGDHEDKPEALSFMYSDLGNGKVTIQSPAKAGAYRLFVYVSDGNNKVATANIPFYVK